MWWCEELVRKRGDNHCRKVIFIWVVYLPFIPRVNLEWLGCSEVLNDQRVVMHIGFIDGC